MAAIGLYNKVAELENRIKALSESGITNVVVDTTPKNIEIPPDVTNKLNSLEFNIVQTNSALTDRIDKCYTKIEDVNNNLTSITSYATEKILNLEARPIPPDVSDRLALIEARPFPPDLTVRVSAIEARLTELNAFSDIYEKINNMNEVINALKQAFITLDDKITNLPVPVPPQVIPTEQM
jgi:hypothetical protein